ncbi:MAG: methionyl-tRNA formyltransferase [Deltaproteobacteria bacterium]|nr:MAG: methionyl-tRNA formyltransferase [Deltaproteobacteria bacterium]
MRVVFMGTPEFAVPSLEALAATPLGEVVLVVSQPDRPARRGRKVTPPPVARRARELGLPIFQPETLRCEDAFSLLRDQHADLFVVVAYGQILRQNVLDLPRLGCLNVHASLLPRWRGAAPIQWAVASGDAVTGVSLMQMERGLDTGPVLAMAPTMIRDGETAGELHDRLSLLGADVLVNALTPLSRGALTPEPQCNDRSTYARMLGVGDRRIDFGRTASRVVWHIHGMTPWPGACVTIGGETLRVLRARVAADVPKDSSCAPGRILAASPEEGLIVACGEGTAVELVEIQRPGRRPVSARDCLHGFSIAPGQDTVDAERTCP